VTHAESNQRPFQMRTRAEYTASLPNIENVLFTCRHELSQVSSQKRSKDIELALMRVPEQVGR
jgi:hypothetical protein